jgi:hypothetical protein
MSTHQPFSRRPDGAAASPKVVDQVLGEEADQTHRLDPLAEPAKGMHVRFNEYELDWLTRLAKREDTSKQRYIRKLVRMQIEAQSRTKKGP